MALLHKGVAAHADGPLKRNGKVDLTDFLQFLQLAVLSQLPDCGNYLFIGQRFFTIVYQVAMDAVNRRQTYRHMQVRSTLFHSSMYNFTKTLHSYSSAARVMTVF